MDGTDCRILEPSPFSPKWFSHKCKGPGVRYEIGICLSTGWIVLVHGPFHCGAYPDLKIFQMGMKKVLLENESVIVDGSYADPRCEYNCKAGVSSRNLHALLWARHETVNRRFKQFGAIGQQFRYDVIRYSDCFHAVANLTQAMIENEDPLFQFSF